jgi:4-amino-4-deoxy-L-arabinose transferase-like glycosyltransferase
MQRVFEISILVIAVAAILFFSTYKLTSSPPPWVDEGIVTQVARNIVLGNGSSIQIAPDTFVSAGFVTTGFPVTYPVALSFKLFGIGLFQARVVMVGFIWLLAASAYGLIRREAGGLAAACTLLLLASFAPLYGHGRTVIGEIPGTALILALLLLIRSRQGQVLSCRFLVGAGLLLGLILATKPVFLIVAVPALLGSFLLFRHERLSARELGVLCVGVCIPLVLWFTSQFDNESLGEILSIYSGNPDRISLGATVLGNVASVFTHLETLYFFGLISLWGASLAVARKERSSSYAERSAFVFALLLGSAYFTTDGYYRYFFPAQILALVYVPLSLSRLAEFVAARMSAATNIVRSTVAGGLLFLCAVQLYETKHNSFVVGHFKNTQSALLQEYLGNVGEGPVLVWGIPEAVLFLPHDNYYQYARFARTERGKEQIPRLLSEAIPEMIIMPTSLLETVPAIDGYPLKYSFEKYSVIARER